MWCLTSNRSSFQKDSMKEEMPDIAKKVCSHLKVVVPLLDHYIWRNGP